MRTVTLPDGSVVPALGLGTWHMGERASSHAAEVEAIVSALEIGYRLIDTAEMYGDGGAEKLIGEALREARVGSPGAVTRDELFIVSKVYPHNATRAGVISACERSLERLGLERIDLYLLHWPGQHPLAGTVAGFEALQARGLVKHWGVSNFDIGDVADLWRTPQGEHCAANQIYYSLSERGAEHDLLPWLRKKRVPTMAYSPIDQGTLAKSKALAELAARRNLTPAQVALAWLMRNGDVIVIPKAVSRAHLLENFKAGDTVLDAQALAELDGLFPPPTSKEPLAML